MGGKIPAGVPEEDAVPSCCIKREKRANLSREEKYRKLKTFVLKTNENKYIYNIFAACITK